MSNEEIKKLENENKEKIEKIAESALEILDTVSKLKEKKLFYGDSDNEADEFFKLAYEITDYAESIVGLYEGLHDKGYDPHFSNQF